MCLFNKRRNKQWIWIIYNKKTDKVTDFEVGSRGYKTANKLFCRNNHNLYSTDNYPFYSKVIPKDKHTIGKIYTQGVESLNGRVRHYLARFHRKDLLSIVFEKYIIGIFALYTRPYSSSNLMISSSSR